MESSKEATFPLNLDTKKKKKKKLGAKKGKLFHSRTFNTQKNRNKEIFLKHR